MSLLLSVYGLIILTPLQREDLSSDWFTISTCYLQGD